MGNSYGYEHIFQIFNDRALHFKNILNDEWRDKWSKYECNNIKYLKWIKVNVNQFLNTYNYERIHIVCILNKHISSNDLIKLIFTFIY